MLNSFKPEGLEIYDEDNQKTTKTHRYRNFATVKPTYQMKNIVIFEYSC